jgi:hypothetical protein
MLSGPLQAFLDGLALAEAVDTPMPDQLQLPLCLAIPPSPTKALTYWNCGEYT